MYTQKASLSLVATAKDKPHGPPLCWVCRCFLVFWCFGAFGPKFSSIAAEFMACAFIRRSSSTSLLLTELGRPGSFLVLEGWSQEYLTAFLAIPYCCMILGTDQPISQR